MSQRRLKRVSPCLTVWLHTCGQQRLRCIAAESLTVLWPEALLTLLLNVLNPGNAPKAYEQPAQLASVYCTDWDLSWSCRDSNVSVTQSSEKLPVLLNAAFLALAAAMLLSVLFYSVSWDEGSFLSTKSAFHPQGENRCPWLFWENEKWFLLCSECREHTETEVVLNWLQIWKSRS